MRINHNIAAMNTNRALAGNNKSTSAALEKLSSGFAINRAADNAAGLAISEKMRAQIRGLNQATANANDGISLIQTAEGGLNETHSILDRMRELAVQSANDTNTDEDRLTIQKEIDQLAKEVTRISTDTEFNTRGLLDGSLVAKYDSSASSSTFAYGPAIKNIDSIDLNETYTGTATVIHKGDKLANATDNAGNPVASYPNINLAGFDKSSSLPDGTYELKLQNVQTLGAKTCDIVLYKDGAVCTNPSVSVSVSNFMANAASTVNMGAELSGITVDAYNDSYWADPTSLGFFTVGTAEEDSVKLEWTDSQGNTLSAEDAEKTFNFKFSDTAATGDTVTISNIKDARLSLHIGANAHQNVKFGVEDCSAAALGVDSLDLTTQATADAAITVIDEAIVTVSGVRAGLGAMQNRLDHTINNLGTAAENLAKAESQIRDVDMADEMSEFTKNNILVQAATSMLAQANQMPQSILSLIQG